MVSETQAECSSCGHRFYKRNGTWDLVIGGRFPGQQDACRWEKEEFQDRHRADHYMAPLFRSVQATRGNKPLRLLSVGCGVGAEVDRLIDEGFECYGIDCGNRSALWHRRDHRDKLLLANGVKLPFCDGCFDVVFAGCVLPHVGVFGDTFQVKPGYWGDRLQLAREMVRVSRTNGMLVISCPNRLFPLDIFHRRGDGYFPRIHFPTDRFLLSLRDFRRLFVEGCGCRSVTPLPVANYWAFHELTRTWLGRVVARLVGGYLRFVSMDSFAALHGSIATPWLVVSVER